MIINICIHKIITVMKLNKILNTLKNIRFMVTYGDVGYGHSYARKDWYKINKQYNEKN